jgi:hypothetical protein
MMMYFCSMFFCVPQGSEKRTSNSHIRFVEQMLKLSKLFNLGVRYHKKKHKQTHCENPIISIIIIINIMIKMNNIDDAYYYSNKNDHAGTSNTNYNSK